MKVVLAFAVLLIALTVMWAQTGTPHGNLVTATAATGDVTFNVYRGSGTQCTGSPIGPLTQVAKGLTSPSFLDPASGLTVGTTYCYVYTGVASSGNESAYSNVATITDTTFPVNPNPPTGCNAQQQ